MNKIKIAAAAAAVATLAIAGAAFAASFTNVQFDNGDTVITGAGGSTVNATFHLVVPANQVVEYVETDVLGDSLAPVCHEVSNTLGYQEGTHDITFPIKLPPNTGTYTLAVKGAGIYGGNHSVDCNDGVVGTASFAGAVRTVASGNNNVGGNEPSQWATLMAMIQALIAKIDKPAPTPTPPPVSIACMSYHQAKAGTQMYARNDANVRFQGFLLSQGASIPALAAGAAFGYMGPQTIAADSWFLSMHPECR